MRICIFTPNFLPAVGGTEFVTDALAQQFHAMGHHVVVLAQGKPAALDVPYPLHWFKRPPLPRAFPERVGKSLAALHEREHFDLFAVNYAHPTGYAAVKLTEKTGVPTVIVSHGGDLYRSSNDRKRAHLWKRTVYSYQHADGLIAISPYIETLIREINPQPRLLELIPNGIHIAQMNETAHKPADFSLTRPFCLCLGNLGPMKGFDDAITAYADARAMLDDLAMVVVGSGELEGQLKEQVRRLNLSEHVLFLGKRTGNDKHWLMHNAAFGLMPSIEEGHPIVGLEFLAVGKPIVCSLNAAFDGMYEDGRNCFRVPAQQPAELSHAMVKMWQADRDVMGEESKRRAAAYDWPMIAKRYLDFYERVLRETR